MKRRYPEKSNVLLVNITRLGDMLQATPTIAGIKAENPDCRVTVLVEKQFEQVCHVIPNIDEVRSIDLSMAVRSIAREQEGIIDAFEYVSHVVDDLRAEQFDYCLNMSSSAYTALLLKLIGVERTGGWTADEEGYRIIESEWARLFASSVFHQNRQFNSLNLVDVFRCSADVEQHPHQLLINVEERDAQKARELIAAASFTNQGPLIAVQAGASQGKRQWAPAHFSKLIRILTEQHQARVVLVGTTKELPIIEKIRQGVGNPNVAVLAGKTSVPELAAVLRESEVLITGDTGPMHMSVAVGTPVVAMFLASAYGFETGPYSEGNLVLQPVIGCGPCNPNKPCARPDCHDTIDPELVVELTMLRLHGDVRRLPDGLVDPRRVIVYRSFFDRYGFCDLEPLSSDAQDPLRTYRAAYRRLWLEDLGGFPAEESAPSRRLKVHDAIEGLEQVVQCAEQGQQLIRRLTDLVRDHRAPGSALGAVSRELTELDRRIEQIGFHYVPLGPVTRMFWFGKENIQGTEALDLASQMGTVYADLKRRCERLAVHYSACA